MPEGRETEMFGVKTSRKHEGRMTFELSFEKYFSLDYMKLGAREEDLPKRGLYKRSHRGLTPGWWTKARLHGGEAWAGIRTELTVKGFEYHNKDFVL